MKEMLTHTPSLMFAMPTEDYAPAAIHGERLCIT